VTVYTVQLRDGTSHHIECERTERNDEWVAFLDGDGQLRLMVPLADLAWIRQEVEPPF
jgi:hypothetical protein